MSLDALAYLLLLIIVIAGGVGLLRVILRKRRHKPRPTYKI